MSHLGRDFSSFQGNLTPADCAGIDFAYVKATQGAGYINPFAPQQVRALRAAGVHVGLYHFLTVTDSLGDQLHNFATYAQSLGGSRLPPALDSETVDPAGWGALATLMTNFAVGVEGWGEPVPNTKSMIYVNLSFYESLPGFPWGRSVWLADPNPGAPHKPCLILQQAPRPEGGGDTKVVDPDVFMGSDADWAAFTGGAEPPVVQPTVTSDPEGDVESTTVTFTTDGNGNAWIASPFAVNKIVGAVPVNIDPAKVGTYTNVPRFAGVTADNQLVFEAGAHNAEFGFTVWAAT